MINVILWLAHVKLSPIALFPLLRVFPAGAICWWLPIFGELKYLVIISLIPGHAFLQQKKKKKEKRSQYGIYLFSRWKQIKINFVLQFAENQVVSWNGDMLTLNDIALEIQDYEKATAAWSHPLFLLCKCAVLSKNIYVISDFPSSVLCLTEEQHTNLWSVCTLAFASFHLPFLFLFFFIILCSVLPLQ